MVKLKIELTIPSDLKDQPIFYLMSSNFKVIPNIVEASFSTSMGWAVLTVEGERDELDKMLSFLRKKNITVNIL